MFVVSQRAVSLLNNELSLSLNFKLLFTPVFGDYTRAGRVISFFFRLFEIVFGGLAILILWLLTFFTPIIWFAIPLAGYIYIKLWILPIIFLVFIVKTVLSRNTPEKRLTKVNENTATKAMRPRTLAFYNNFRKKGLSALTNLKYDPQILYVLRKTELPWELIEKLTHSPDFNKDQILAASYKNALEHKTRYLEMEDLFLAILSNISKIDTLLSTYKSNIATVSQTVKWIVDEREKLSKLFFWQDDYTLSIMGGIGKGMTGRVTPLLDSVSEDFTKKAQKGWIKDIVGRKAEIARLAEILSGTNKNVLIIGEPGSGKTSIVKGLAFNIVRGIDFGDLKYKRIVRLETGGLIAGAKSPGEIADKINKIMEEVEKSGDIVLFIDEIHTLIAGSNDENGDGSNIFSLLQPHLEGTKVQFIGATNIENYRKHIEPNGSFARMFEIMELPQASKDDTLEILKFTAKYFELDYGITITYPALQKVVELSEKLIHERVLPDKAIDVINRTATRVAHSTKYLTVEEVSVEISSLTHVPVSALSEEESTKLLNIEQALKKRVIGQDEALVQVGAALKRARVGIRNENKPIASFLFVGTTGVGKTETAKALAREYFGDEKTMIRLDMSEYQQADSIDRLIGSPDAKTKGILTEAVRTKPFALLLLDEIEKANSNILLTFLQVLDDGRLTDSTGRVIDFTNTIIIATSNVGTRAIQEISQRNGQFKEMQDTAMKEVREKFAPEFLNRFNGIIVFKPLDIPSATKIADLMLNSVRKMAEAKGIKVTFKPELINELVNKGYNPEWGARPLARVIENSVETYLATKLLANEIKQGDEIELGLEVFAEAQN